MIALLHFYYTPVYTLILTLSRKIVNVSRKFRIFRTQ